MCCLSRGPAKVVCSSSWPRQLLTETRTTSRPEYSMLCKGCDKKQSRVGRGRPTERQQQDHRAAVKVKREARSSNR
jgi:hypothetical protein